MARPTPTTVIPHRDYYDAAPLHSGADPDARGTPVSPGMNGKPFFISRPHDNVPRIVAQLDKVLGPGKAEFVIGLQDPDQVAAVEDVVEDIEDEPEVPRPRLFSGMLRRLQSPE